MCVGGVCVCEEGSREFGIMRCVCVRGGVVGNFEIMVCVCVCVGGGVGEDFGIGDMMSVI